MAPTSLIMHANKCVVTRSRAVYLSIVVSLKETFTLEASREMTLPNRSIRNNRGNLRSFAIRITMDPDLCRSFEYMKISPNVAPLCNITTASNGKQLIRSRKNQPLMYCTTSGPSVRCRRTPRRLAKRSPTRTTTPTTLNQKDGAGARPR